MGARGFAVACFVVLAALVAAALRSRTRAVDAQLRGPTSSEAQAPEAEAVPPYTFERLVDALPAEHHEALMWGTYRPGIYAGVKSRTYPHALAAGLMWVAKAPNSDRAPHGNAPFALRHACSQDDGLTYGYHLHDGRNVGEQVITDPAAAMRLTTTFVRVHAGAAGGEAGLEREQGDGVMEADDEWALHIAAEALDGEESSNVGSSGSGRRSLLLYVALDSTHDPILDSDAKGAVQANSEGALPPPLRIVQVASGPSAAREGAAGGGDTAGARAAAAEPSSAAQTAAAPAGNTAAVAAAAAVRATGFLDGLGSFELTIGQAPPASAAASAAAAGAGIAASAGGADGGSGGGGAPALRNGAQGEAEAAAAVEVLQWSSAGALPLSTLAERVRALLEAGGGRLPQGQTAVAAAGGGSSAGVGGSGGSAEEGARLLVVQVSGTLPFSAQLTFRSTARGSAAATTARSAGGSADAAAARGGGAAASTVSLGGGRDTDGGSGSGLGRASLATGRTAGAVLLRPGAVQAAATAFGSAFERRFERAFRLSAARGLGAAAAAAAASASAGGGAGSRGEEGGAAGRLSSTQVASGRRVLSLLLGSHAFLHGPSLLRSPPPPPAASVVAAAASAAAAAPAVSETAATPLFTAVPSRSFFPRGFLWDEGFHQLLVCRFDAAISADVLLHWAGLVQPDGWVAREQILGDEARARVPAQFAPQSREVANPPTLLLLLEALVQRRQAARSASAAAAGSGGGGSEAAAAAAAAADEAAILEAAIGAALPALERWFGWLLSSQAAIIPPAAAAAPSAAPAAGANAPAPSDAAGAAGRVRSAAAAEAARAHGAANGAAMAAAEAQYARVVAALGAAATATDEPAHAVLPGFGFYWRGRSTADGRLNAMTLASGLDDYPRATEPDGSERHVDLLCWLAVGARALGAAAAALPGAAARPAAHYAALQTSLLSALRRLHWDSERALFADVGRTANEGRFVEHVVIKCQAEPPSQARGGGGGEAVEVDVPMERLQRMAGSGGRSPCPRTHPRYLFPLGDGRGGLLTRRRWKGDGRAKLGFVRHVGYLSFFPLFLRLLPADSAEVGILLRALTQPSLLWSPHGLRSLAATDRFHNVENAPGDAPYWRGPIWVNINYLALSGLHHYASTPGPHVEAARAAYEELRANLVGNILREFERTGFLFEQYDPESGAGQRTRPFNGWTTLVLLAMAEIY